jgi:MFS family permease
MKVSESTRLAVFVGYVVLAESAFYSVVPPLVPGFVRDVHMTTVEVGVLVAAYPAGVLVAAIPSMALIDWRGVRIGTIVGILLLVTSTLAFAWSNTPVLLDTARFVQGVGGAVAWAGALAWLTTTSHVNRRASVIGGTLGAASIGMVLGPPIGALASHAGRGLVFTALAVVLGVLAFLAPAASPASARTRDSLGALIGLLRDATSALGLALLAGIGIVTGSVAALMPLLVYRLQGSATVIAAILALSYLVGAALQIVMGRLSDRFGRLLPTLCGFAIAAVCLPTLPFWAGVAVLGAVAVVAIACVSSLWTPTAAMVSDGADHGPSGQAVAVATLNAAGAAGGAVAASSIAQATGFPLPFALLGGLCATSALVLLIRHRLVATMPVAARPN